MCTRKKSQAKERQKYGKGKKMNIGQCEWRERRTVRKIRKKGNFWSQKFYSAKCILFYFIFFFFFIHLLADFFLISFVRSSSFSCYSLVWRWVRSLCYTRFLYLLSIDFHMKLDFFSRWFCSTFFLFLQQKEHSVECFFWADKLHLKHSNTYCRSIS